MKAERLNRKTHLKKLSTKPASETIFHDLTEPEQPGGGEDQSFALESLINDKEISKEALEALPHAFQDERDVLAWCVMLLSESPQANALIKDAAKKGWTVGLCDLNSDGFYLDVVKKQIWLDYFMLTPSALGRSLYFRSALVTTFIRALRDVWHEHRVGAFEERYSPEDVLMLERVRSADCDTATVFVAWELRGAGFGETWRHLLGSEEGDMAIIFTRFLERDPGALFSGTALAYAFRQWYANESRVDGCDHDTLESLDDILLAAGCQNPFGKSSLTAKDVETLSTLPDGTVYLSGMGDTVLCDPFFSGMHDEINQTHLFHLMYDLEVTMVANVPFRDRGLARKIFPEGEIVTGRL